MQLLLTQSVYVQNVNAAYPSHTPPTFQATCYRYKLSIIEYSGATLYAALNMVNKLHA